MSLNLSDDIKIYNLTKGQSIPDWVSSKRRRKLEKQHVEFRDGIQLIQDFDFPDMSTSLAMTRDGKYCLATGTYKPSMRVYDVNELTLKFEHGLDIEAIKVLPISDDYSKVILLELDRFLEIYSNGMRHFRFRVPHFNRDMAFNAETSDLFVATTANEMYRFNLEQGQFLTPLPSVANGFTCCTLSPYHKLLLCGTADGRVEAFDPRCEQSVAVLDCSLSTVLEDSMHQIVGAGNSISALKYRDPLMFAAGTASGHVLLYDLRSSRPVLVKDQRLGLPIKKIDFVTNQHTPHAVLSMDSRCLKFWNGLDGQPYGAIEPGVDLMDFERYQNSGLVFFATQSPQMLQYFVPAFGPAPKWCYHLDAIVDDLESTKTPSVFDDYKFITKEELIEMGLGHLIGSNLLRAHMHGYFIDLRLYNRAKVLSQDDEITRRTREKIRERFAAQNTTLVTPKQAAKGIKVNKQLAEHLLNFAAADDQNSKRKKAKIGVNTAAILEDKRFSALFENKEFEIEAESDAFKQMEKRSGKRRIGRAAGSEDETDDDEEGPTSGLYGDEEAAHTASEDDYNADDTPSSDEDDDATDEDDDEDNDDDEEEDESSRKPVPQWDSPLTQSASKKPNAFKFVAADSRRALNTIKQGEKDVDKDSGESFGARRKKMLAKNKNVVSVTESFGTKSITFIPKAANEDEKNAAAKKHLAERKAVRRSAQTISKSLPKRPR